MKVDAGKNICDTGSAVHLERIFSADGRGSVRSRAESDHMMLTSSTREMFGNSTYQCSGGDESDGSVKLNLRNRGGLVAASFDDVGW